MQFKIWLKVFVGFQNILVYTLQSILQNNILQQNLAFEPQPGLPLEKATHASCLRQSPCFLEWSKVNYSRHRKSQLAGHRSPSSPRSSRLAKGTDDVSLSISTPVQAVRSHTSPCLQKHPLIFTRVEVSHLIYSLGLNCFSAC